jgi:phage baseplate assembly protein W
MIGTDSTTGKHLTDLDHLRQSIADILNTPVGSRVMRREYGSRLHELQDVPLTSANVVEIYSAVSEALRKWEPRIRLKQVSVASVQDGVMEVDLIGYYLHNGTEIVLKGIQVG